MSHQSQAPPVACSLTAGSLAERLAEWRAVKAEALISESAVGNTITARYAGREGVIERLRALVAAEADCCPSLVFDLAEEDDAIRLAVTTPGDARDLLALVRQPAEVEDAGA